VRRSGIFFMTDNGAGGGFESFAGRVSRDAQRRIGETEVA